MKNNQNFAFNRRVRAVIGANARKSILLAVYYLAPLAVSLKSYALPVFLSPEHSLPTGHYSKKTLLQKTEHYDLDLWIKVKTSLAQEGWIHSENVLLPIDFSQKAQIKENAPIRTEPALGAPLIVGSQSLSMVKIISRTGAWVKIQNEKAPYQKGYAEVRSLSPSLRDIGFFVTLESVGAHKTVNGSEYKRIARGTKLRPVSLKQGWFKVEMISEEKSQSSEKKLQLSDDKKEIFYISSTAAILSRLRFAESVKTNKGSVDPASVDLVKDKVYEIQSRTNWLFNRSSVNQLSKTPERSTTTKQVLASFDPLIMVSEDYQRWGKARLVGDNLWWRSTEELDLNLKSLELSLKEIRSRNLYDFAKSPLNPQVMIASAGGIFHSINGVTWNSLPTFKFENQPIAFSENGVLFVGSMVSRDNGKSFDPYIRWDQLIHSLTLHNPKRFDNVRITKILPQDRFGRDLKLSLETGSQSMQVRTKDGGLTWQKIL